MVKSLKRHFYQSRRFFFCNPCPIDIFPRTQITKIQQCLGLTFDLICFRCKHASRVTQATLQKMLWGEIVLGFFSQERYFLREKTQVLLFLFRFLSGSYNLDRVVFQVEIHFNYRLYTMTPGGF